MKASHPVDIEMVDKAEEEFVVTPSPKFRYSYAVMKEGVLQHLDRDYSYDVVPKELENGILFQGIHRLPKGTSFKIELKRPATVYFFFHQCSDGGYSKILPHLKDWQKCKSAPKYDIHNGIHGLNMLMYKLEGKTGTYYIGPSTEERGCVGMVIKPL